MKRTPLRKVGRIGEANIEARKRIAEIARRNNLIACELVLDDGCLGYSYLAPAHRHKRSWYKGDVEKLSDYNEWVAACQSCHNTIENDPILTEEVFKKLRPLRTLKVDI